MIHALLSTAVPPRAQVALLVHPCLVLRVEVGAAVLLTVDPLVLGPVPLLVVRLLVLGLSVVG